MAIVEMGVGVAPLPRNFWSGVVAANQSPYLTAPLLGAEGVGWFDAAALGRLLRIYIPSRLWTSPTDPTDPGYTYGPQWRLGIALSSEGLSGIVQSTYIGAASLLPGNTLTTGRTRPAPCVFQPAPGVPEYISVQGQQARYLTVGLILASGLVQSVCCPVDLTLCESWSS